MPDGDERRHLDVFGDAEEALDLRFVGEVQCRQHGAEPETMRCQQDVLHGRVDGRIGSGIGSHLGSVVFTAGEALAIEAHEEKHRDRVEVLGVAVRRARSLPAGHLGLSGRIASNRPVLGLTACLTDGISATRP